MLDTKYSYTELLLAEDDGLGEIVVSTSSGDFVGGPRAVAGAFKRPFAEDDEPAVVGAGRPHKVVFIGHGGQRRLEMRASSPLL